MGLNIIIFRFTYYYTSRLLPCNVKYVATKSNMSYSLLVLFGVPFLPLLEIRILLNPCFLGICIQKPREDLFYAEKCMGKKRPV